MVTGCQNCDKKFEITEADQTFYNKIKVPPPTRCPRCRTKRRMSFLNQRRLFRHKDTISGENIFSTFPPEAQFNICDTQYWFSDAWDPLSYGRDYNFDRSFFEQFDELHRSVPLPARHVRDLVDSDYCNNANNLKDCYLCFDGNSSDNCRYLVGFTACRDSMDMYQCSDMELSYEIFSANKCFQCFFSNEVGECNDVWFSRDCEGCQDCFGCANLKNKKFYIFNKPHTKEDYEKFMKEQKLDSYTGFVAARKKTKEFLDSQPNRYMHGSQNENVVGEYVYHSHNAEFCYQGSEMENVKYLQNMGNNVRDSYDYTNWGGGAELVYEAVSAGFGISQVMFSQTCADSVSNLEYCSTIVDSHYLFGCVSLRGKKYCILNKQYTETEYFALREKIVAQMKTLPYKDSRGKTYTYGEFFPPEMSPINYKQSLAADFYPLSDEEIAKEGYRPGEVDLNTTVATMKSADLPDKIGDTDEGIVSEVLECNLCKQPYRIVAKELEFLKKYGVAAPRNCPDCRYTERIKDRNPLTWWQRSCMNTGCQNQFKTSFPPDTKAIVYCEACYEGIVG